MDNASKNAGDMIQKYGPSLEFPFYSFPPLVNC